MSQPLVGIVKSGLDRAERARDEYQRKLTEPEQAPRHGGHLVKDDANSAPNNHHDNEYVDTWDGPCHLCFRLHLLH